MDGLDVLLSSAPASQNGLDVLLSAQPAQAASAPAQSQPGRGFADQANDALIAANQHFMRPLHGAAQLVENGAAKLAGMFPDNRVSRYVIDTANADNKAMAEGEKQYQATVPNSPGAYAGATIGEIAPFLLGGTASKLQDAGDYVASKLPAVVTGSRLGGIVSKGVSGATQGGIISAAQPVNSGDYWAEKLKQTEAGTILGGTIPLVAGAVKGAVGAAVNAAKPLVAPKSVVAPTLAQWATSNGMPLEDAVNLLRSDQQIIPGSLPTTAQVLKNPSLVAAEKQIGNNPLFKTAIAARENANNEARLTALHTLAGGEQDLAGALSARASAVSPWTGEGGILSAGAPVDARPIIQQLQKLKDSPLGVRPTIGKAADDILGTIKDRAQPGADGELLVSPGILDAVRQNVKDYLAAHAPNGVVGTQQGAAFEPVRNSIIDSVERANPGYRAYLATYAEKSGPVNAMETAGRILDDVANSGRGPNSSGAPQVTLAGYRSAMSRALKKSPYPLPTSDQAALEAVRSDLQRAAISNSLRVPGSDTAYNLHAPGWLASQLYGPGFGGPTQLVKAIGGAAGAYAGGLPGFAGGYLGAGKLSELANSRVNNALADALLNPEQAAGLLEKQLPKASKALSKKQLLLEKAPQLGLLMSTKQPDLLQH